MGSNSDLGIYCNKEIKRDPSKKLAIILTGFTCAGKDTVMDELEKIGLAYHVVTATSRPRRIDEGEPEGKYVWLENVRERESNENIGEYLESVKQEYGLVEADEHYGYVYGLPLESLQKEGQGVPVIRPDINGAITLHKELPKFGFQPLCIAVMPDNWEQIYNILLEERGGSVDEKMHRLEEDNNNVEKYVDTVNYFLHNTRENFKEFSGLERSIKGCKYILERYRSI